MTAQRRTKPDVWLIPHALLFTQRPGFIPAPDALVIDEGFIAGATPEKADRFPLDAMEASGLTLKQGGDLDLEAARASLLRALREHDDGPVRRSLLVKHGVTLALADWAHKAEWRRKREPEIIPGMPEAARRAIAAEVGPHNKDVKRWAGVWYELQEMLRGEAAESGRLRLRYDPKTESRALERRSLRTIRRSWKAPALLLDATLPSVALLKPVLGHPVEIRADVAAVWSPHAKVRQIIGAPVSASKLGIVEGRDAVERDAVERDAAENEKRAVGEILRLIRLRAALVAPEHFIAVMGQKALVEKLRAMGLPLNVEAGHFGAVAGLDRWKDAAGLICIGRPLPDPRSMEIAAGVITGAPPTPAVSENGRTVWYERITSGIRLAAGGGWAVGHVQHPDPVAEALRWQACEANLLQAIGRLRPLRRDEPFFLDIVSDVPLPIVVDEAVTWKAACPGRWADMCPAGVLLDNPAHVQVAFSELATTRKASRLVAATVALFPIVNSLIGKRATVTAVAYKRRGKGRPATAYLLPNAPPDIAGWLTERLGPIDWVRPAAPTAGEETPPPAEPADVVDWLNSRFDAAAERSPAPPPEWAPPARPASPYRLRLRCQPPATRFECVACDPPHALPIERGGVTGRQQGRGRGRALRSGVGAGVALHPAANSRVGGK